MAQQAATPLQQALRGILVADLAMKRAKGPDEWMAAFDDWWAAKQWREEIEAAVKPKRRERPRAEDFFFKSYPPEPKSRDAQNAHQQKKEEIQNLQSEIDRRTELGDIDHGPLPRAQPRHGNSVDRAMRMRLAMKEERLVRDKKNSS